MNKIFFLSSCSTCSRLIKELGISSKDFEMQDIKTNKITPIQIDEMCSMAGSYEALFSRVALKYRALGLQDKKLSDQDYRRLILEEYTFLKRPVFVVRKNIKSGAEIFIRQLPQKYCRCEGCAQMTKVLRAHLAVAVVNIIYGANFTIAKTVMPAYIGPLGFIIIRVAISLCLFFLIAPFFTKEKAEMRDMPMFAVCGLFGVAINQMLFFKGLALTFPINGAIIMTTNPILVLVIAAILIKEKITLRKSIGIALGATGAITLLLTGKEISFHSDTFLGDMFIFTNAMSYGIFLVISKPLLKKYNPLTVIKWSFFFGLMIAIPFGWEQLAEIRWEALTFPLWLAVVYVVIGSTFLAYLLNTIGLNTLSPAVVSSYIYLQPIIATLIAMAAGKDRITWHHILSMALIFTGVYLVSNAASKTEVEKTVSS